MPVWEDSSLSQKDKTSSQLLVVSRYCDHQRFCHSKCLKLLKHPRHMLQHRQDVLGI